MGLWLLPLLSLLLGVSSITITVVLPSNADCVNKNVSSPFFVPYCAATTPAVDVVSIVDSAWRETGANSNWEYATTAPCAFVCSSAATFTACQTSAGSANILNYYPATTQCCVLNCSATTARYNSTRFDRTFLISYLSLLSSLSLHFFLLLRFSP